MLVLFGSLSTLSDSKEGMMGCNLSSCLLRKWHKLHATRKEQRQIILVRITSGSRPKRNPTRPGLRSIWFYLVIRAGVNESNAPVCKWGGRYDSYTREEMGTILLGYVGSSIN